MFDGPHGVALQMRQNLVTGRGTDTIAGIENIETGAGNNRITGNAHRNELRGGGNDTLASGGGADVLTDGGSRVHFVFADHVGNDRVTDFQKGLDRLVIKGNRADGFADLTVSNWVDGAVVTLGGRAPRSSSQALR